MTYLERRELAVGQGERLEPYREPAVPRADHVLDLDLARLGVLGAHHAHDRAELARCQARVLDRPRASHNYLARREDCSSRAFAGQSKAEQHREARNPSARARGGPRIKPHVQSAVALGARMRMTTAAKRDGLYSEFLVCVASVRRSSLTCKFIVATTFCVAVSTASCQAYTSLTASASRLPRLVRTCVRMRTPDSACV